MEVLKANPVQTTDRAFDCTDFIGEVKSVIVIAKNSYFMEMPSLFGLIMLPGFLGNRQEKSKARFR